VRSLEKLREWRGKKMRFQMTLEGAECVRHSDAGWHNKFFENYWNIIIVPAAVAMLLERCNGREQSSWASVRRRSSYNVVLTGCDADRPHTHNSRCPHGSLGLHQSCTHRIQRPPTVRFCSRAGGRYVGPRMAMSNTLCNIQIDATLTSLPGPPTQTMLTLGWGQQYAHRSHASHSPVIKRILAEAGAYYTRELLFSPSTAMKSRTVYYTRVRIICEIFRYIRGP